MKKSILPVAAMATLLLLTGTASADRLGGDWALEFQVRPTFLNFRDPGVGIAAKHHFTHRTAIRAGFTTSSTSSDMDVSQVEHRVSIYDSSSVGLNATVSQELRNTTVFAHVVRDLGIGNRIAVFVEAGPLIRRIVNAQSQDVTYTVPLNQDLQTTWMDYESWEYGGEAQGGFEWFVRNRLSVAARYGVWATWTRAKRHEIFSDTYTNNQSLENRDATIHSFNIGTTSATFSVIAYW